MHVDYARLMAGGIPAVVWSLVRPNSRLFRAGDRRRIDRMTTDLEERIARFQNMADADPTNELGHFSLGKALIEAGRFAEAAGSLARAIEINATLSKAYQFLGQALDESGNRDEAIAQLTKGLEIADKQGDRMPAEAMVLMLKEWGAAVPERNADQQAGPASSGSQPGVEGFQCSRCRQPQGKLTKPPFKGALGEKIFEHVCETCWREWIPMGTKVINELGLVLRDPASQSTYDQYMVEFLQLEDV
jgi:Fe-S cluster biosynthesis and repair protein YggX